MFELYGPTNNKTYSNVEYVVRYVPNNNARYTFIENLNLNCKLIRRNAGWEFQHSKYSLPLAYTFNTFDDIPELFI